MLAKGMIMRRLKLCGAVVVLALLSAGMAGIMAQNAEAERLDETSPAKEKQVQAPSAADKPLAPQTPVRVVPISKDKADIVAPASPAPKPAAALQPTPSASSAESKRENLQVQLDLATVIKVPRETATIVVGNPIIADTTVQNTGILVITGKSYGTTNIMALNAQGELLKEIMVGVSASSSPKALTVQRGMDRETWACASNCQRTITLGDGDQYFSSFSSQITGRNGLSQGVTPSSTTR
jgi:Flp pilus assembly secretin CpaC